MSSVKLVDRVGVEPTTNGLCLYRQILLLGGTLKVRCSTTELPIRCRIVKLLLLLYCSVNRFTQRVII